MLSNGDLRHLCQIAAAWLEYPYNQNSILANAKLSDLVYAWREISNTEAVMAWLAWVTDEDEIFLEVLLQLRYVGIRTDTGRYQGLLLSNVGEFFGGKEYIMEGPDKIE